MKKVFALILTALMLSSLTACSNNEKPNDGYINVSDQNSKPENSTNSEQSTTSEESSKSEQSTTPEESSKSEQSTTLEESSKSEQSTTPEESSKSEQSTTPEESSKSEQSTTPEESSKPEETSKPETPPAQGSKLPLKDYPDGSYFTKDGKECGDHSGCDWLHDCNCINFDGGIQAFAFARYVYFTNSGEHLGSKTELNADVTAQSAKTTLKPLPAGSYLGVRTKEGSPHAMIIISTSEDGITVYQGNYGGRCLVTAPTYTWEEFARRFPHLNDYAE